MPIGATKSSLALLLLPIGDSLYGIICTPTHHPSYGWLDVCEDCSDKAGLD